MIDTMNVNALIERVENRYNPENDTIPGAPSVTWADSQLLDIVKTLAMQVQDLQDQIREIPEVNGYYTAQKVSEMIITIAEMRVASSEVLEMIRPAYSWTQPYTNLSNLIKKEITREDHNK